jgi:hypothetical protein
LSALTCVPTAYFILDICILQSHMAVTLKNPFFEEKYEIRVYASMVKRNAINMNVVYNFIQGRSCKLSSLATPPDDPQQATPSVTQRACRLCWNAEGARWRAWIRGGRSQDSYRCRTATGRLVAWSFVHCAKEATGGASFRPKKSHRRRTAARRLAGAARSFVPSVSDPAILQLGSAKKSTAENTSSHTMQMKLWCCCCVLRP